jgi:hypothetical protein
VLNNTGLNASLMGIGPGEPYDVPVQPGIYATYPLPTGDGISQVYYGSPTVLPDDEVKADVVVRLQYYQARNGLPVTEPDWLKFSSHSPFNLMVPDNAIAHGSTMSYSLYRGVAIPFIMVRHDMPMIRVSCRSLRMTT